jgi:carbonic anhydrase
MVFGLTRKDAARSPAPRAYLTTRSGHAMIAKCTFTAVIALGFTGTAFGQHWGYHGEAAPQNWGKLDPKFALCSNGRNQSPIDIAGSIKAELKPLKLDYKAGAADIVNNGHTVQINYAPGNPLDLEGRGYELKQFHFHAPSENKINGKQYPLEGHLVHADKEGNLAVVSVMFEEGAANELLTKLWEKMPAKVGDKGPLAAGMSVNQLLPKDKAYYRFNGSLTTPPCSEGVRWIVMKHPVAASKAQVAQFSKAVGVANNRPLQPVHARAILQ